MRYFSTLPCSQLYKLKWLHVGHVEWMNTRRGKQFWCFSREDVYNTIRNLIYRYTISECLISISVSSVALVCRCRSRLFHSIFPAGRRLGEYNYNAVIEYRAGENNSSNAHRKRCTSTQYIYAYVSEIKGSTRKRKYNQKCLLCSNWRRNIFVSVLFFFNLLLLLLISFALFGSFLISFAFASTLFLSAVHRHPRCCRRRVLLLSFTCRSVHFLFRSCSMQQTAKPFAVIEGELSS